MERLSIETLNNVLDVMGTIEKCCGGFEDSLEIAKYEFLKKLKEYMDLEAQGKLLKLPCAVGKTVYCVDPYCDGNNWKCIDRPHYTRCINCSLREKNVHERKFSLEMVQNFGKSVFLTKEEAEVTLKQQGR